MRELTVVERIIEAFLLKQLRVRALLDDVSVYAFPSGGEGI